MRPFAALPLLLALAGQCHALPVKYEFTAVVNDMFEHNGSTGVNVEVSYSEMSGYRFVLGDTWSGSFTYDYDMVLSQGYQPAQPAEGSYLLYKGLMSTTIKNANTGFEFQSSPDLNWLALMQIRNSLPGKDWDTFTFTTHASGQNFESGDITLYDGTGTAIDGPTPPSSLSFDRYGIKTVHYGFLRRSDGSQMHAYAEMTSLREVSTDPVAVDEPVSLMLISLGFAGIYMARRRPQQQFVTPK